MDAASPVARSIVIIGAAGGYGAQNHGCQDGPEVLRSLGFLEQLRDVGIACRWDGILHLPPDAARPPLESVVVLCEQLARKVGGIVAQGGFPVVLGGDHSCAIGTWSGVRSAMPEQSRLGLIWIDAHMDSHTFATTPSNAIHGMPLACLLGHGEARLTHMGSSCPILLPEDVCLIGTRSYEEGESRLLQKLGVRIFFMEEIHRRGLEAVWNEALHIVQRDTAGFGVSLDLDALDPGEEPGVGSPEPGGMREKRVAAMLAMLRGNPRLLGMEIAEYNPYRDTRFVTAQAVGELIAAIATPGT